KGRALDSNLSATRWLPGTRSPSRWRVRRQAPESGPGRVGRSSTSRGGRGGGNFGASGRYALALVLSQVVEPQNRGTWALLRRQSRVGSSRLRIPRHGT